MRNLVGSRLWIGAFAVFLISFLILAFCGTRVHEGGSFGLIIADKHKSGIHEVIAGDPATYQFSVENLSADKSIKLSHIGRSCQCTSVNIEALKLSPKESTVASISLNTTGLTNGPDNTEFFIEWQYEGDPEIHKTIKNISLNVQKLFDYNPASVDFGSIQENQHSAADILINTAPNPQIWDDLVAVTENSLSPITLFKSKISDNKYKLTISLDVTQLPIGVFHSAVFLYVAKNGKNVSASSYKYIIPVSAKIISDISTQPSVLYLGSVRSNSTPLHQLFRIVSNQNNHLSFVSINSSNNTFATASMMQGGRDGLAFDAVFNAKNTGDQSGKFLIKIADENQIKIVSIPYLAYVKPN